MLRVLSCLFLALVILTPTSMFAYAKTPSVLFNFEKAKTAHDAAVINAIQSEGFIDIMKEAMDEDFSLPQSVAVNFKNIEDKYEGPYYDPETKEVVIPYHFWTYVSGEFENTAEEQISTNELNTLTGDVVIHTLYHEIAHALIDIMALPITGREENAADELAVLMILDHFENGSDIALSAADFFEIEGSYIEEITDEDLFGEHALDDQRFFNTLCLIYGHGDVQVEDIMQELKVEEGRLDLCIDDYAKRRDAWDKLLKIK